MMTIGLLALSASFSPAWALPGSDAVWTELSSSPVRIECAEVAGEPWCRSQGVVEAPIDRVASTLEDMANQGEIFASVLSIRMLAPDTVHVVLDFPNMLSDRDYVARYTQATDGTARLYRWVPVEHPEAPPQEGVVRLSKMAGEWRLEPDGGRTRVSYTWQADLSGSFPTWALSVARKRAGWEALHDLANAQKAALTAP